MGRLGAFKPVAKYSWLRVFTDDMEFPAIEQSDREGIEEFQINRVDQVLHQKLYLMQVALTFGRYTGKLIYCEVYQHIYLKKLWARKPKRTAYIHTLLPWAIVLLEEKTFQKLIRLFIAKGETFNTG